jgi:hypothetical protein
MEMSVSLLNGPREELHAWFLTKMLGRDISATELKRDAKLASIIQRSSFIHPVSGALVRFSLPDESSASSQQYLAAE